jgi:hypothetical protein
MENEFDSQTNDHDTEGHPPIQATREKELDGQTADDQTDNRPYIQMTVEDELDGQADKHEFEDRQSNQEPLVIEPDGRRPLPGSEEHLSIPVTIENEYAESLIHRVEEDQTLQRSQACVLKAIADPVSNLTLPLTKEKADESKINKKFFFDPKEGLLDVRSDENNYLDEQAA